MVCPVNSNLYHYGGLGQRQLLGNNPVKYVDPDGRDIRESPFDSKSGAALGALTGSAGLAKDSEGNYAIFVKVEVGIGFGGDI